MQINPVSEQTYPKPIKGDLGPKQIAWLKERMQFFGVYKAQAEAPVGVGVIVPPDLGNAEAV